MTQEFNITTERLFLTPYHLDDLDAIYQMNSNPDVMHYLGGAQNFEQVKAYIIHEQERWHRLGFGWWSIFIKDTDQLIGAACLQHLDKDESAPIEIGWRLLPQFHGAGYATEAGKAAMDFAFNKVGLNRVIAVAEQENTASTKVMERICMTYIGIKAAYGSQCYWYEKIRD